MAAMRLFGSLTSPFVRRVRVVAGELGVPFELVDAFSDEGQRELRRLTPVWKVPTADLDGRVLWDSALIIEELCTSRGFEGWREPDLDERALITAVDEALLALVRRFYLKRDGVDVNAPAALRKDVERVHAILSWLEGRLAPGGFLTSDARFGLAELALFTALDWMRFRAMWQLEEHPPLLEFMDAHRARPSLVETAPPAAMA